MSLKYFNSPEEFLTFAKTELNVMDDISLDTAFRKLPIWSSLNALILISRIHEETGILISSSELASMITFGDIFDKIISQQ
jgi:acyl carrier protein